LQNISFFIIEAEYILFRENLKREAALNIDAEKRNENAVLNRLNNNTLPGLSPPSLAV
jgi:hypothetical protein